MNSKIYAAMNKKYGTIDSRTMAYSQQDVNCLIAQNRLNISEYTIVEV
jgi:hypothetical protein